MRTNTQTPFLECALYQYVFCRICQCNKIAAFAYTHGPLTISIHHVCMRIMYAYNVKLNIRDAHTESTRIHAFDFFLILGLVLMWLGQSYTTYTVHSTYLMEVQRLNNAELTHTHHA